jgi:L-fuculose-phosphate aldolase
VPARSPERGDAAAGVVRACRRLDARGLVAGQDGNVSVRLGPDRLLVTPAGRTKGEVEAAELVEVDLAGRVVAGNGRPSSELGMHLAIYAARPDAVAVVHAHPPTATGFAVAGADFMAPVLPEIILLTGPVPLVPYAMPGTPAVAEALAPWLAGHDAFLLANHGATTLGPSLEVAVQRMESLEHAARILLAARLVGRVTELTPAQAAALAALRAAAGPPASHDPSSSVQETRA